MPDLNTNGGAAAAEGEAQNTPNWWPDVEIVPEARPGVIADLAILAGHSATVRAALVKAQA